MILNQLEVRDVLVQRHKKGFYVFYNQMKSGCTTEISIKHQHISAVRSLYSAFSGINRTLFNMSQSHLLICFLSGYCCLKKNFYIDLSDNDEFSFCEEKEKNSFHFCHSRSTKTVLVKKFVGLENNSSQILDTIKYLEGKM